VKIENDHQSADGQSTIKIIAEISNESSIENRAITFKSTRSVFNNDQKEITVDADGAGSAIAFARCDKSGSDDISVSVLSKYKKNISITFDTAYPDRIEVNFPTLQLHQGLSNLQTITATVSRTIGKPSDLLQVAFNDSFLGSGPIGYFNNITLTNTSGIATANYGIDSTSNIGVVLIYAYLSTPSGIIKDSTSFVLVH
jgi:hypothetical protein